jgi:hypothetical protein
VPTLADVGGELLSYWHTYRFILDPPIIDTPYFAELHANTLSASFWFGLSRLFQRRPGQKTPNARDGNADPMPRRAIDRVNEIQVLCIRRHVPILAYRASLPYFNI